MQRVFVLDTKKTPLAPCRPSRARKLLDDSSGEVVFAAELEHRGQKINMITAIVTKGQKIGRYIRRMAIKASGSFKGSGKK